MPFFPAQHGHKEGWWNPWLDAWACMDVIIPLQTTPLTSALEGFCNSDACVMHGKWSFVELTLKQST